MNSNIELELYQSKNGVNAYKVHNSHLVKYIIALTKNKTMYFSEFSTLDDMFAFYDSINV